MSIISDIFSGGAEGLFKGVKDIITTFKADPLEVMKIQQAVDQAQMEFQLGLSQAQTRINEIEAASQDKFVSRWRPAIGWICGAAYAYTFLLQPFAVFILAASGHAVEATQLPHIDVSELSMVLMGLLGLGAMRSFDKLHK
jgi:hypothetical protein